MKTIICFSFLFVLSCVNTKKNITNEELNVLLNKTTMQYFQTKDKKYLDVAYEQLKYNKDFVEKGLSGKNSLPIVSLLLNLKKYDELEELLIKNKSINEYSRLNTLNTTRYLKFKDKDLPKAKLYIAESLKMIKDTIDKKPNDSLRYADYFSMRMFLVGKKGALKEVDSMKAVNKRYSDIFYDAILKDAIESYPDEYLPK
ncbi:hypothetical protein [Flavobacterium crassostreae]|nr:hypothetical protein [Flavobacterium crassostreae]